MVRRYRERQLVLARLVAVARAVVEDTPGVRWVDRVPLVGLAQVLHRVFRESPEPERMRSMAEAAAERIDRGIAPAAVIGVLLGAWKILAGRFPRVESEKLRQLALHYSGKPRGGNVRNDECRVSNAECPTGGGAGRRATDGTWKGMAGGRLASMQDEPTAEEEVAQSQAGEKLRQALGSFAPGERRVVIARLCQQRSFDAIAQEQQVTRADVADVLQRARGPVQDNTTYFDSEQYWVEAAQPAV